MKGVFAALLVTSALLCCKDPDPKCANVTGTIPRKMTIDSCSDGVTREVACDPSTDGDWMCGCKRNGAVGRTFMKFAAHATTTGADRRELEDYLGRQCQWSLRLH